MNKKFVTLIVGTTLSVMTSLATATPVETGFVYSTDSDGVVSHSYRIATANEEQPLNFTFYRNRLSQSGTTINENVLVGQWVRPVSEKANITLWTGLLKNDIRNFVSYAGMYDVKVGDADHMWLSYGHDAIGTVNAYRQGITTNTGTFSYSHKPVEDVELLLKGQHVAYSDSNNQQILDLSITKNFSERFKLGLKYGYDSADFQVPGIYYVPLQQSTFSIVPEWNIPIGVGKLVFTGEQSFAGHDSTGSINLHSVSADYKINNVSVGTTYFRTDDYSSRDWHMNWNHNW